MEKTSYKLALLLVLLAASAYLGLSAVEGNINGEGISQVLAIRCANDGDCIHLRCIDPNPVVRCKDGKCVCSPLIA